MDELCNLHQAEWWSLVNKMCSKSSVNISNDQRLRLRKGIETVRVLGSHALHPKLLLHVAQQFRLLYDRSEEIEMQVVLCQRAEILWKATIPLLERMQRRQVVREVGSKLFEYGA